MPVLWVETEHFRLGSALEEYVPKEPEEIAELQAELVALRPLLLDLPAKPKKLDPWLRLHLFARRLESLHDDLRERLGVLEESPSEPAGDGRAVPAFGMQEKFSVLLTQKKSTLARFTREFCFVERGEVHVHNFHEKGFLFFGISDESLALSDSDLHYAVVYGVSQILLCSIHGYPHQPPAWWQHGVGLWFARQCEPRAALYVRPAGEALPPEELQDWQPLVRGRAEARLCIGWSEMLARSAWNDQAFGENIVLWSRVDYLMQAGLARELLPLLHAPDVPEPDGAQALCSVAGKSLEELDRDWTAWVLENYRKKRRSPRRRTSTTSARAEIRVTDHRARGSGRSRGRRVADLRSV